MVTGVSIADWSNYLSVLAGAAATLTGLVFVAVSIQSLPHPLDTGTDGASRRIDYAVVWSCGYFNGRAYSTTAAGCTGNGDSGGGVVSLAGPDGASGAVSEKRDGSSAAVGGDQDNPDTVRQCSRGEDVSGHFANGFTVVRPACRV